MGASKWIHDVQSPQKVEIDQNGTITRCCYVHYQEGILLVLELIPELVTYYTKEQFDSLESICLCTDQHVHL